MFIFFWSFRFFENLILLAERRRCLKKKKGKRRKLGPGFDSKKAIFGPSFDSTAYMLLLHMWHVTDLVPTFYAKFHFFSKVESRIWPFKIRTILSAFSRPRSLKFLFPQRKLKNLVSPFQKPKCRHQIGHHAMGSQGPPAQAVLLKDIAEVARHNSIFSRSQQWSEYGWRT